jgi:chemotaxis protein methyltransferase WspC
MKRIEHWLRNSIGLDAGSVGSGMIQRAVRHRLKNLGLQRLEDYLEFLKHSRAEAQELVESVVVTETWFFRDSEPVTALVNLVKERGLPAHGKGPWRILSLPCASGEEPFSLVMALRDAGVPPQWFQIDGMDISPRALARAARGVYSKNSFRGRDLGFRGRYFTAGPEGHELDPTIRDCVRFYQANIVADDFLPSPASYDFVFCRNLLIYFDPAMRGKALRKLERMLTPAGILFLGPVEQPLATEHGFVKADVPLTHACRKPDLSPRSPRLARAPKRASVASRSQLKLDPRSSRPVGHRPPGAASRPNASPARTDLETARNLANAGRFEEAAAVCEAHLRESRTSAQGHYLLGLVREAGGSADALDCYRRALYLEPNHYESLLRMALLLQEKGEVARARAFQNRAERARTKL